MVDNCSANGAWSTRKRAKHKEKLAKKTKKNKAKTQAIKPRSGVGAWGTSPPQKKRAKRKETLP